MSQTTSTIAIATGQTRARKNRRRGTSAPLRGLTPLVVGLALWQVFGSDDSPYFPRPSAWLAAITQLQGEGALLPALGATLQSLVISLAIATVVGAALGILVGASRLLDRALGPTLEFFRATPSSAMVPIGVLLLGYTLTMKTSLTVLAAIWPILLNTRAAMREFNPTLLDVAAVFQMSWMRRVRTIIMPAVATAILLGIRVGAPVAIIVTLLVEILTGVTGIGALLAQSQQEYDSAATFGLLVLIGIVALLFNFCIAAIESFFTRHLPPA
ncbi:ABC transporter permease [Microbacterium oryzae]|uniref:ABC transporter permease n=1 Tax=Microbacterium oryzae TaxID=743009 RepID=UPI0025B16347|nr:ABC transporter permease [Microbacterium oryzae]MDN3309760.1 ABC transporter permease [Microbacterium oryzae]